MLLSSLIAYLHFLFAIGVIFCILFEKLSFKQDLSENEAIRLRKIDGFYGLSAVLVLVIGFIRVFYFEKGSEFYFANPFFHVKLLTFVIIGILSIYPTVVFYKWRKLDKGAFPLHLSAVEFKRINRILTAETILVIILLLAASLMAKGISF